MLIRHDTDLWSAECELGWQGGLVPIPIRMTVFRLADGRLVLHSPIELSPALRAELEALGPVGFLVIPRMHGKYAEAAARLYPQAQLIAAPSPPRKRESLAWSGSLADEPLAAWGREIETHLVRGFRLDEVVLFHRPTRTLVISDLCFYVDRSDSAYARFFFRANGMWKHFGPSRIIRALGVSDRAALRESLEHICAWNFERIVPAHGIVIEKDGPAALREAWRPTLG
jgi:Domain of unknown function (DUF4336)